MGRVLLFQAILALSLFLSLSGFIDGAVVKPFLHQNEYLLQNDSVENGSSQLYMEHSCNLIFYIGSKKAWESGTYGKANHSCWAQLQLNGNFVVVGDNKVLWSNNTGWVIGNYTLYVKDERFVVEPASTTDRAHKPVWAVKNEQVEYSKEV